jgi:hypothetical protein
MERSETFMERSETFMERSETFMESLCKRSRTVNAYNVERSGTFESERSNALERIVQNVHASKTKEFL